MAAWSYINKADGLVPRARALLPSIVDQPVVLVGLALAAAAYVDHVVGATSGLPIFYVVALLSVAVIARQRATIAKLRQAQLGPNSQSLLRVATGADDDPQKLRAEAVRALKARDDFLATAAHELKTPVTSLRGFAQLTLLRLNRHETIDREQLIHALQVIDVQSHRLSELATRLLDVARIDSGSLEIDRRVVNVGHLVADLTALVQRRHSLHSFQIDVEPAIEAALDADRVQQILACLLDNAVRYSPDGGAIEVSARASSGQSVQIVVRDHGIGIPPDRRASLFSRCAPGDPHDYRAGLGLGLYLCRRMAELHGGTAAADFPNDGGTRIVVRLPRAASRAATGIT